MSDPPYVPTQNHRGRATTREVWVFGIVDTSQQPSLGYMEVVPAHNAATLLPSIQAHVAPGTIVYSDEWAAYNQVGNLPNVGSYRTVNHSLHFVDPVTGTHTQNVGSYWSRVKNKFKRMKGVASEQLPSYLDEFMWRERYGRTANTALNSILGDIATQYQV